MTDKELLEHLEERLAEIHAEEQKYSHILEAVLLCLGGAMMIGLGALAFMVMG
jgi:hypothetical protein